MFYSQKTGGFYDKAIHTARQIPQDAVEITKAHHAALLEAQAQGKVIQADKNGKPVAVEPDAPTAAQLALSEIAALEASITPRRLREAVQGTDNGWLANVEAQIAALRATL